MRQETMMFWEGSGISKTIRKQSAPIQTDYHANTLSLNFYRPDAFPGAKPTAGV